jgi:curved DNA-binding protein CbpA
MDLSQAFKILEIDETASFSEVKLAYRDLASVWHPDRHSQNSRLLEKSLQKMKELNAAYDLLSMFYTELDRSKPRNRQYEEEKFIVVTCKKCGTQNRVQNLSGVTFKCGKCRTDLFSENTFNDNEERILCADGECIGIIRNGRCSECGKTLEEGRKEDERKSKIYQEIYRNQEKVAPKRQKRKNVIKYGFIGVVVILFGYGIFSENSSNPDLNKNRKGARDVQYQNISLQPTQNIDIHQFNENDFSSNFLKAEDLKMLQENLKTIGYEIGTIDGIIGPNTISECNKFSADFSTFSKFNSIADLLSCAKVHSTVSTVYPEWLEIVHGNLLDEWFAKQPANFKKEVVSALKSNDPRKITIVLNFYFFDKESPPELPIPENGIYWKSFPEGVAPLKISTRDREQSHFIKITESKTNKEILKAFLRGGHVLEFDVPLGSYIIKYAAGEKWYGEHFLFGPYTAFGKADKVFEFEQIGYEVSGYSVELYLQPHGNLHTSRLSAFQF